jgi:uncharacterized protein YbjT (DUF2867 family)
LLSSVSNLMWREIAMSRSLNVLVTGATGKQGGAVARLLMKRGHKVRGLTRKLDSPAAKALEKDGATLAQGSFDDKASLVRAAQGVDAVFAMSTPFEAGMEAETRQGIALAEAAKEAGVKHFVYTSVAGADQNTGIPHFDSKYKVEQHLKQSGLPYTVIAPVFFMENFQGPFGGLDLAGGKVSFPLPANRPLQQISVENIGAFGALVIDRRESFLGKRIDIASDELTGEKLAEIFSGIAGKKVQYQAIPLKALEGQMPEDMLRMFQWFDQVGYHGDVAALRKSYPEVGWHTFEQWARAQRWTPAG